MIAVLSYSSYEQGTDPVIDWLVYYKANFFKISMDDLLHQGPKYYTYLKDNDIIYRGISIRDKIKVIWYRRFFKPLSLETIGNSFFPNIKEELEDEVEYLTEYFFSVLKDKTWLPHFNSYKNNKLISLSNAQKNGINIPQTIVTNNKKDLELFFNSCECNVISKPIYFSGYYVQGKYTYAIYTNNITSEFLKEVPDTFFPTLFQEKVESEYEIRSFYIDGNFYSSAILTNNTSKEVDIKLSFGAKETHWVNYQLPKKEEEKLRNFMQDSNLNTGSIDLLKNKKGEYVFLEVNPVGQYSAPSFRANYQIDKVIAEWLIKNDR